MITETITHIESDVATRIAIQNKLSPNEHLEVNSSSCGVSIFSQDIKLACRQIAALQLRPNTEIVDDPCREVERPLLAEPSPMASCSASSGFLGRHCNDVRRSEYIRASLMSQRTGSILKTSTATPRSTPSPLPLNAIELVPLVSTWAVPLLPAPAEAPACA